MVRHARISQDEHSVPEEGPGVSDHPGEIGPWEPPFTFIERATDYFWGCLSRVSQPSMSLAKAVLGRLSLQGDRPQ